MHDGHYGRTIAIIVRKCQQMPTLETAIEAFLLDQRARLNSEKTVQDYEVKLAIFADFTGSIALECVTTTQIREWVVVFSFSHGK